MDHWGKLIIYLSLSLLDRISLNLTQVTPTSSSSNTTTIYSLTQTGISWDADKHKYGTREATLSSLSSSDNNISAILIPPPKWQEVWAEKWGKGYNSTNLPDLASWEAFQVWMRVAGLPDFRYYIKRGINGDGWDIYIYIYIHCWWRILGWIKFTCSHTPLYYFFSLLKKIIFSKSGSWFTWWSMATRYLRQWVEIDSRGERNVIILFLPPLSLFQHSMLDHSMELNP